MSKTNAKANPKNQDLGDRNQGAEPGQEQKGERVNRLNMGAGNGTRLEGKNQGRVRGEGQRRDSKREKGDSRRSRGR